MVHEPERTFEGSVTAWFRERYGDDAVDTQDHQSEPNWYCDITVDTGYATLYIEVESRASSVRDGVAQALGYCADSDHGVPMVVTPRGHIDPVRADRLRQSTTVVIREFDAETMTWGPFDGDGDGEPDGDGDG